MRLTFELELPNGNFGVLDFLKLRSGSSASTLTQAGQEASVRQERRKDLAFASCSGFGWQSLETWQCFFMFGGCSWSVSGHYL